MPTSGLCTRRGRSQPSVLSKRRRRSTGLPSAEGRGMAGSARGAAVRVGIAGAVWNKPEAPAATAGASSLLGTLPVGLPRRFLADRRRGKAGVRLQRQPDLPGNSGIRAGWPDQHNCLPNSRWSPSIRRRRRSLDRRYGTLRQLPKRRRRPAAWPGRPRFRESPRWNPNI